MRTRLRHPKSLSLKILRVSPYNSKILVLSRLEVYCFHRPEGEGVPPPRIRKPHVGGVVPFKSVWLDRAILQPEPSFTRVFPILVSSSSDLSRRSLTPRYCFGSASNIPTEAKPG